MGPNRRQSILQVANVISYAENTLRLTTQLIFFGRGEGKAIWRIVRTSEKNPGFAPALSHDIYLVREKIIS